MKLYLFLRSLVWTSILAVAFVVALIVAGLLGQIELVFTFGFAALTFAALGGKAD